MLEKILSLAIGYLLGSFLTADIVCRAWTGKPASEVGSGNPGMTNIFRNVGWKPGVLVLIGDILKTVIAMGISYLLFADSVGKVCIQYAGLGAVLGHDYSFMAHGHGGNGVAASATWMVLGLGGWGVAAGLLSAATTFITGLMPVSAVVLAVAAIPAAFLSEGLETGLVFCVACVIMLFKQHDGIVRVIHGEEERKFQLVGKKPDDKHEIQGELQEHKES